MEKSSGTAGGSKVRAMRDEAMGRAMMERASGKWVRRRFLAVRIATGFVLALISVLAVYFAATMAGQRTAAEIHRNAAETLAVQAEILTGALEKYRLLPPVLSRQQDIVDLFVSDAPLAARQVRAAQKAEEIAGLSGAKEVVFLNPDGTILASARDVFLDVPAGLVELMDAAGQGRLGRAAVSLTPESRAYAFGSGIRRDGHLVGIIVVYADFDSIEATWSLSANPIFVTDQTGIIFLSNRAPWRLQPVSAASGGDEGTLGFRPAGLHRMDLSRELPLLGWTLHVLGDTRPADDARLFGGLFAGLAGLLVAVLAFIFLRRREHLVMQRRRDRALALHLERVIRDRTRSLSETNRSLSREVEERQQAEDKLHRTQAELVQTGKLAVLGRMSAALSHELNQPLAALKTYADTTARLLQRGRVEQAKENLARISAMVDRMAELAGALLSFSRRSDKAAGPVRLAQVLDEAIILVNTRARGAGLAIKVDPALRELSVMGGRVLLAQVFVNLINNSIDAQAGQRDGAVNILLDHAGADVAVLVKDNGPGIPEAARASIFDPFFTTKPVGEGIGMGLSIAYNIVHEFGGRIELEEGAGPGTTFKVVLPGVGGREQAAE